ncbi:MAG: MFS transporter [Pseudomonadota bacterium]
MLNFPRNLWILVTAQAFGSCGTIMVILVGGIVGALLAPSEDLSTAPVTAVIVGVAVSTVPAALLMRWVGRRAGFILGTLFAIAGAALGAYAISLQDFWLFTAAMLPIGANQAFVQQYRFAAIESVGKDLAPKAVSTVLLGSIVAAYLGPEVAVRAADWVGEAVYAGSFIGLCFCYLVAIAALSQLRLPELAATGEDAQAGRPLLKILATPRTMTAVAGAAIGYGVMTLLMTATPISMHVHRAFSMTDTAAVIQAHVMAMFLPSLFTGRLVSRFGETAMLLAGVATNFIAIAVAIHGETWVHFLISLSALGVGWNLLFISATTLLARSYASSERYTVQAANDFSVFGFQAGASLSAGFLINIIGWEQLAAIATVPLLMFAALAIFRHAIDRPAAAPGQTP